MIPTTIPWCKVIIVYIINLAKVHGKFLKSIYDNTIGSFTLIKIFAHDTQLGLRKPLLLHIKSMSHNSYQCFLLSSYSVLRYLIKKSSINVVTLSYELKLLTATQFITLHSILTRLSSSIINITSHFCQRLIRVITTIHTI